MPSARHPRLIDGRIARSIAVLAVGQIVCWGTVGLPAVVARDIAGDLGMSLSMAFAGSSVLYAAMGIAAPFFGGPFERHGGRRVLAAGAAGAAPGMLLIGFATSPVVYLAGWAVMGIACASCLTTGAHIFVAEIAGRRSRSVIAVLMLVTGLSGTVFLPITAMLSHAVGWRATTVIYAGLQIACGLLYFVALPRRPYLGAEGAGAAAPEPLPPAPPGAYGLIAGAIALHSFVGFGLSAVMIETLKALGRPAVEAVAVGSALGLAQVTARAVDFFGSRRDGLVTALTAAAMVPPALLMLALAGGTAWGAWSFVIVYGFASGLLAVARATLPLVFFEAGAYARMATRIALPSNIMAALAPPLLAALLTGYGPGASIFAVAAAAIAALGLLALLAWRRRG